MCDYSLHDVSSRPARAGDRLVTTGFSGTITHGFAAADQCHVAVCLQPGTELTFDDEVRFAPYGTLEIETLPERAARFRQINLDQPMMHHDALEFPGGRIVLVTSLCEHQHATVLQLPVTADWVPGGSAILDDLARSPRAEFAARSSE